MKRPYIFLALDLETEQEAYLLAKQTQDYIQGYKIGPQLYMKHGPKVIENLRSYGEIFLDFKFYDIPSTTVQAVKSCYELGASYVTVHASLQDETLVELAKLEKNFQKKGKFRILNVTVLSSEKAEQENIEKRVLSLAHRAYDRGLTSFVCSPLELKVLRQALPSAFLVTPGIRFKGDNKQDQCRVLTPKEALLLGSSALVVGRSITQAKDPKQASQKLMESLL